MALTYELHLPIMQFYLEYVIPSMHVYLKCETAEI